MKSLQLQKNISEWQQVKLGDCLDKNPDYGINAAATKYSSSLPTYVRITDISDDGHLIRAGLTSVSHIDSADYYLNEGDMVFTRTGASVGKTYLYNKFDGKLVYAGFLIRVKTDQSKLLPEYLNFFTRTHEYWKWILITSSRSGQPGINSQELKSLKLILPPLPEQTRIVAVLETWDKTIEKLAKKIEIKKDIEKSLMVELLKGKMRLAGFKDKWETVKLGTVGEIVSGGTPDTTNKEYWDGNISWITPTEITKLKGKYISGTQRMITSLGLKNCSANLIPPYSLILCSRATVGDCAINTKEITTNQGFKNIIPKKIDIDYLYYLILTKKYLLKKMASGSTFLEFSKRDIEKLKIFIPTSKKEQIAIGQLLSTADSEITTLEHKLFILKDQKKFLLNNLITGAIRTPEDLTINK